MNGRFLSLTICSIVNANTVHEAQRALRPQDKPYPEHYFNISNLRNTTYTYRGTYQRTHRTQNR